MPSSSQSRERKPDRALQDAAVARCPSCGRRVSTSIPCPQHGTLAPTDDEIDSSRIHDQTPRFPGYRGARLIGRGGFGDVYRAEPEGGGPLAAIKVSRADRPEARAALRQEIEVMAAVGPPHVPALFAKGKLDDGRAYVVMELVDAPTLATLLLPGRAPISIADACGFAEALLAALAAVHAHDFVHRDLKPENAFVNAAGRATLVDFGLVIRAGEAIEGGAGVGTAEYMAPEQCDPDGDVDARADLYAVGVILFEMIAQRPPFWGPRAVVQEAHRSRRPPRLASMADGRAIPPAVEDLVARCLAKDRADRFPDARALQDALAEARAAAAAEPAKAPEAPAEPPAARARSRNERITVGLLFFEADTDLAALQARVAAHGGQLAHGVAGRFAAVFGQDLGDNPARRALHAGEDLVRAGLCDKARLDLAAVTAQPRRDGTKRFVSPLFTRDDRYPSADDPPGITVSPAAAAVLPDAGDARPGAPPPATSSEEPTLTAEITDGPLVGREVVVEALVAGARAAVERRAPATATVIGATGHGKSHLFRVLGHRLGALGVADVLDLRAREPALGDVDHTLAELLRRCLNLPGVAPPDGGAEILRARLGPGGAELVPAVALALGWMTTGAADAALGGALRTLSAAPGALRSALTVAAGEALRRRADARPLCVVLDDAHYASDVLLAGLEYAAIAEHGTTIWICALGRPTFAAEHPTWGERAAQHDAHQLGPLDAESAAALCRRLLLPAESVPDSAVQRLVDRAQAVPLLLVELVRGLRRPGMNIVRKSPKGEGYYVATDELDLLPDLPLIEWLARAEMEALAPALQEHARLIALLGAQVTKADVEGVLLRLEEQGGDADLPLDARIGTQRLVSSGIVVEDRHGRIGFRHELVREAIARATPESMRRRIHHAAASYYADLPPSGGEERRLAQLAYHGSAAGMAAAAERAYLDLAERARARHAYIDAERLYSRALEQPVIEGDTDRGAAYRCRGLMRYRIGRHHDALTDFSFARSMAAEQGDVITQVEILLDEATALDWLNEFKSSEERVLTAQSLATGGTTPLVEARLLLGLGRAAHRFSRNEEAAALLERAAAAAEPLEDDGYETRIIALSMLGFIYQGLSRLDDAQRALDETIALCESHGDRFHLGGAINNRALVWSYLADKDRMCADTNRALSLAREFAQPTLEFASEVNVGEALLLLDDPQAAEPHIRRALDLDRRLTGDAIRPVIALLEARLHLYLGNVARVRAILQRIRARETEARNRGEGDALMVPVEEVMWSMLDLATTETNERAWDDLEMRAQQLSLGLEQIELVETRAMWTAQRGRADEARLHLQRAMALASRVPNCLGPRLSRRLRELN